MNKDLSFSEQILDQLEKIKKSLESEMSANMSIGINSEYLHRITAKLPKHSNSFDQSETQSRSKLSATDLTPQNELIESITMNNLPVDISSITDQTTIYSESTKKYKFV
ncbi:MAG: hypothetical protein Harvfovirus10_16 [Harvfovirus sp.]|uniref:Uncharacterized protein n=1 Tax=Harvfovirus sp. TaxID=2487768 RepID=A0A3G5A129_9VIRU|nr:MAG: hypothetical protein Harvfovirus10_16 [Harvfovirus sp.]